VHKRGLPTNVKMRHDSHYVEDLSQSRRFIGRIIPTHKIEPNPEQPRTEIGDLSELSSSIKEKGVLEPLLVKPLEKTDKWLIIAGERRWRAAQLAGLTEVPCIEMDLDEQSVAEIALIENLQRKDLTIWEEADALLALCQKFGYTHEDLAKKIGKSRSSVTESLSIANLPISVRESCKRNAINSKSNLLLIARKFDEPEMLRSVVALSQRNNFKDEVNLNDLGHENSNASDKLDASDKITKESNKESNDELKKGLNSFRTQIFPARLFRHSGENNEYKLEIKFKKTARKDDAINALKETLSNLQKD
jgi:ParB family transcriptional regulator, chromosome partitioning protein